jgi:hypothetical protein
MAHGLPAPLITPLANDYCAGAVTISNGLSLGQNLVPTTSPFNAGPIGLQMLGNVGYTNGVSLAPIGMPGCYLWSECVVINTLVASGIQATYTMAIPNARPSTALGRAESLRRLERCRVQGGVDCDLHAPFGQFGRFLAVERRAQPRRHDEARVLLEVAEDDLDVAEPQARTAAAEACGAYAAVGADTERRRAALTEDRELVDGDAGDIAFSGCRGDRFAVEATAQGDQRFVAENGSHFAPRRLVHLSHLAFVDEHLRVR